MDSAWKVRGKFEGVWAWKVHAESLRVRDWAWAGKMRGKFEGQGFESAWKVRGRGLRKVLEIKCEGAAWNVRGRCVGGRGYGL